MRLQKFLSRAGVASRRAAERMMATGRVRVNGSPATVMGTRVDPAADTVEVDGRRVELSPARWIALHKPPGCVTTRSDPRGRRTVYDVLPEELHELFHVGRLDADSEGLLLFTNQGDVAHRIMHPGFEVRRVYDVTVRGHMDEDAIARLLDGVRLEDGVARALAVERRPKSDRRHAAGDGQNATDGRRTRDRAPRLRITLAEGRNREVRRMFEHVGHPVTRLVRVRYGPIELGELDAGEWRDLRPPEVHALEGIGRDGRDD